MAYQPIVDVSPPRILSYEALLRTTTPEIKNPGEVLELAEQTDRGLQIGHVSTRREVDLIAEAKSRGVPVTCEYAPHHLFLTASPNTGHGIPAFFEMNPPLRSAEDVAYLWQHMDVADCIATDHAPHTLDEKQSARPPMGMPGLEDMLTLLLGAVHDGRMTLEDIARLCCEGPARTFGIARKGKIETGFDADLTLVDLPDEHLIGQRQTYSQCGWAAYAGLPATGGVRRGVQEGPGGGGRRTCGVNRGRRRRSSMP